MTVKQCELFNNCIFSKINKSLDLLKSKSLNFVIF
jgi:hypothetical protein